MARGQPACSPFRNAGHRDWPARHLAGVALGVVLSLNLETLVHGLERLLDTRFMDASVYLMSDLPASIEVDDVTLIAATAFALCCLSTLYPAWRAAKTDPARALRHD
jgi:lipoprotein-releasing system permease protein